MQTLLKFFDDGRRDEGTFDAGMQFALERMLVDPDFLLRVHRDPHPQANGAPQPSAIASPISNSRLGCRSSCGGAFLTSRCSTLAEQRKLTDPARSRGK